MNSLILSELHQMELLAEADSNRLGRLSALARRCREACLEVGRPGLRARIAAALRGRTPDSVTC